MMASKLSLVFILHTYSDNLCNKQTNMTNATIITCLSVPTSQDILVDMEMQDGSS